MIAIIILWAVVFIASLVFAKGDNAPMLFGLNAFLSIVLGLLFLAEATVLYKLIGAGVFLFGIYMIVRIVSKG